MKKKALPLMVLLAGCAPGPSLKKADPHDLQWVSIAGGDFTMKDDTDPRHPSNFLVLKDFDMARTPVTNSQYRACVQAGACTAAHDYGEKFNGAAQPVVGATWDQADAFSRWAGGRLPSEAQWEYAALSRGRKTAVKPDCGRAVVYEKTLGFGCGRGSTWPVCSKPRGNTTQGLCDMAGNVLEWMADASLGPATPPPGDGSARKCPGTECSRLFRGNSWDDLNFEGGPILSRSNDNQGEETDYLGFRPVRDSGPR